MALSPWRTWPGARRRPCLFPSRSWIGLVKLTVSWYSWVVGTATYLCLRLILWAGGVERRNMQGSRRWGIIAGLPANVLRALVLWSRSDFSDRGTHERSEGLAEHCKRLRKLALDIAHIDLAIAWLISSDYDSWPKFLRAMKWDSRDSLSSRENSPFWLTAGWDSQTFQASQRPIKWTKIRYFHCICFQGLCEPLVLM